MLPLKSKVAPYAKIALSNTCAFDSFTQIVACTLNDSENLSKALETIDKTSVTNLFLDFCIELGQKVVSSSTYRRRLDIILKIHGKSDNLPGGIQILNTESTATATIEKLITALPTVIDEKKCSNCDLRENEKLAYLSLPAPQESWSDLNNLVIGSLEETVADCIQCSARKSKRISRKISEYWVIIEVLEFSRLEDDCDAARECEVIIIQQH